MGEKVSSEDVEQNRLCSPNCNTQYAGVSVTIGNLQRGSGSNSRATLDIITSEQ